MTEVRVEFYCGSRADETPRALVIDGRRLPVKRVMERRNIGGGRAGEAAQRTFVVEAEDGSVWNINEAPEAMGGWVVELERK